jgi:phage-related protein
MPRRPTLKPTPKTREPRTAAIIADVAPGEERGDAYRAVYTVRFAARVFVLHVFQKKAKRGISPPKPDMDLVKERLKAAARRAKELEDE